ncbi:MAG: ABC transporter permease [Elusimicrobiota bacterium]
MKRFWGILRGNKQALAGFIILCGFFLMAAAGPHIVELDTTTNYEGRFQLPSLEHWLGTDYSGRDTFQQIVHGSRDVMLIAFSTAVFGVLLAVLVGISAGLIGGKTDFLLMRVVEVFLTVPTFPIMAIFASLLKIRDPVSFGLVLAIWSWPPLARAIRAQVLSLKQAEFIEVCRCLGMSTSHIMFKELLPNIVPFITINFIHIAKGAITASVGIMLLGLVPLSLTNWGMMLNLAAFSTGSIFVPNALPYLLSPMLAIVLFQYSLICFGSAVENLFDPRLRSR